MEAPKDLDLGEHVVEIALHPTRQIIAAGCISGGVSIYEFSTVKENECLFDLTHHRKSVRALVFSQNGSALFTGSVDKSIQAVNVETGEVFYKVPKAHGDAVNTLLKISPDVIASGDDSGTIKLWDLRQQRAVREYNAQDDFISEFYFRESENTLLAASGEGTLGVYDIRMHKEVHVSDNQEDELLSIVPVRGGDRIVCGSQEGVLNIWSWGLWGDISDRFPGHPNSIDAMVSVTSAQGDEYLCTGSSDGIIRVVTILPNALVGVIGDHAGFPVERLRATQDGRMIASCSHDETVKFWDLAYLLDEAAEDEDLEGVTAEADPPGTRYSRALSDDDDDDDGDDDGFEDVDSDEEEAKQARATATPKQTGARKRTRGKPNESFYDEMD